MQSSKTFSLGQRSFSVGDDSEEEIKPLENEIDTNLAEEVRKYRQKLAQCLVDKQAISIDELDWCEDLSQYKEWLLKIIKYSQKLKDSVNEDFLKTFHDARSL